ncbi:hypothetical protein KK083_01155 [Fulvivirgaceae bacterium PWU4]|uniref:Uncharacterized protein n=1 Tax=Chryseosolibacter histidini TaxID=2782349 RepID=A0AAP2DFC5_9BACT|nr:class I SAM-dependent methyltransferase [Chryseosolibacter histidini]MBT1695463.1 hypothetical protein [Chryseosolibacter histidini]
MGLHFVRAMLGENFAWREASHNTGTDIKDLKERSKNDPFLGELTILAKEMHLLLNDEQPSAFTRVAELSADFRKKYAREIDSTPGLKEFFENVSFVLARGYQAGVDRSSWRGEQVRPEAHMIPHMLHGESFQYYKWLGRMSSGFGDIVEIGCWMGATTFQLADGLSENNLNPKKKIHVIDTFRWDDDLALYGDHKSLKNKRTGDDFLDDFNAYTNLYREHIIPHRHMFVCDEALTQDSARQAVTNSSNPIEYLIQDIAPDYEFNEYIWKLYSPFFVDGKTILVYGEYGNFFATSLRRFVQDYSDHLIPIHKVYGNVKAFLYRQ